MIKASRAASARPARQARRLLGPFGLVVGPTLRLHSGCRRRGAGALKPFIFQKLQLRAQASTIKAAKRMVEREGPEVWDILEEVIREHPAAEPRTTLHLGIQAFGVVMMRGKAIQLHRWSARRSTPTSTAPDGVHVPLSSSPVEARALMLSRTTSSRRQRRPDHRAVSGRRARSTS